jgi:hypothetical protein
MGDDTGIIIDLESSVIIERDRIKVSIRLHLEREHVAVVLKT